MFSSTSAVSSAIRWLTSWLAGRFLRPYRKAAQTSSGVGASVMTASSGLSVNIRTPATTTATSDCRMKTSP
jgi:hypothetical protein